MNNTERFRCIIVGRGTLPMICAEIALKKGHEILCMVSADPQIGLWAAERGIAAEAPYGDWPARLSLKPFDYLFSIGNDFILSDEVLQLPLRLAINFHDAPLPRYAGTHACAWALMNQEQIHGVSWHTMRSQVDAGDILLQQAVEIGEDDSTFTLTTKCFEAAIATFAELIDLPSCGLPWAKAQEINGRTFFHRYQRPKAACLLSWNRTANELAGFIRALDFGSQPNPMGLPKISIGDEFFVVAKARPQTSLQSAAPGTLTMVSEDSLTIAASSGELVIGELLTIDGQPLQMTEVIARHNLQAGQRFVDADIETLARLTAFNAAVCRHESFWSDRLADLRPASLPEATSNPPQSEPRRGRASIALPEEVTKLLNEPSSLWRADDFWPAAIGTFLARIGVGQQFDIGVAQREAAEWSGLFATCTPLRINVSPEQSFAEAYQAIGQAAELGAAQKTYARDMVARYPGLRAVARQKNAFALPVGVEVVKSFDDNIASNRTYDASQLMFVIAEQEQSCFACYDAQSLQAEQVGAILQQLTNYLKGIARNPDCRIAELSVLSEQESRRMLEQWNATATEFASDGCLHELFEKQALLTPYAPAVVCRDRQLTYGELDSRANQLANHLRKLGVTAESLVGISLDRSPEMMVGLLGILKAGGAYLPLDPNYPAERLSFMLEDSQAAVLLTQESLAERLAPGGATRLLIDTDWPRIARESSAKPESHTTPANLAYVIYTSGSTGKPKGVMVEHRNVVNFFAAMDGVIGAEDAGAWLAVTSISFDISVLELFWTLGRGFKVVLYENAETRVAKAGASASPKKMDFGLFYFASNDDEDAAGKYRLLLEGAKFADRNGFSAVWTPERHFHAFGGLYPNPAITGAAIAALTENIAIRAGSVVAPLHSPVRIAEEWAVVDNLSKGRIGISFASGWHDRDFVLAPENYEERKEIMLRHIDTVRRLWRGESLTTRGGASNEVSVRIFPQPVQAELPFWLTAGGNPETFRLAGELGANVLTHLLFQKPEDIAERISIYRRAWKNAGHPGEGQVTIMLHTFIGEDFNQVRQTVKQPFCNYLKSSVDLIQQVTRGLGVELKENLSETDIEAILEHAFERYFETSGLMGTPESCLQMIDRLKEMGVDEVGCLVDFGIDVETVLAGLKFINHLKEQSNRMPEAGAESIAELIKRHQITHMQCTPSMAKMLAAEADSLDALASLDKLLLGGEALPAALVEQLKGSVGGTIINMYGPTETTIWSTTQPIENPAQTISIGRPVANTEVYVTDSQMQPVPVGKAGELLIGGAGVTRGYLNRAELTAEMFIPNPFDRASSSRLYRTGDLARFMEDGRLEFLGRIDQQVKIRGYRIELGEIEAALCRHEAVREAAVIAKADAMGDKRLFACVIAQQGHSISELSLKGFLQQRLPEPMIPAHIVALERLPLTPNNKVDRKALATLEVRAKETALLFVAPQSEMERSVAEVWGNLLGIERVGLRDNFFDIGGDSLLAVQAVSQLREATGYDLKLVELFKYPTVSSLATLLTGDGKADAAMQQSLNRAAARRELRTRRQASGRANAPAR
jgi:natural product biosynthesis luciferase-like monooxygenase protein